MGNSALCGDCCVDCCPRLFKKRRRLTVLCYGFDKCGKTSFIHKAIRMKGGTVDSLGYDAANFTVETLDVGAKTKLEFFDISGVKDDRVLWPTYFNFGVQGMVYVIDGAASDEVIEENIQQLLFLIQHDAIVKPRNPDYSGEFRNVDGTFSKDLASIQRQRNAAVYSTDDVVSKIEEEENQKQNDDQQNNSQSQPGNETAEPIQPPLQQHNQQSNSSSFNNTTNTNNNTSPTTTTTIRPSCNGGHFDTPVAIIINKGDKFLKDRKLMTGAENGNAQFASSLCARFSLQDRILSAVRAKIASTLLAPKRMTSSVDFNENTGSDSQTNHSANTGTSTTTATTKKTLNFSRDQEMQEKKSIMQHHDRNASISGDELSDMNVNKNNNNKNENSSVNDAPNSTPDKNKNTNSSTLNNNNNNSSAVGSPTSSNVPPAEAIPFDVQVNCAGFRWQVFEVSSVNGENVLNAIDWLTNAMLRGKKP